MNFKDHLKKYLNQKEIDNLIASFDQKDEHALLLNTKKMSEETFKKYFPNIQKHPFVDNGYFYDKNEYELGKHIFHEMGI